MQPSEKDAGDYVCVIKNDAGEISKKISVTKSKLCLYINATDECDFFLPRDAMRKRGLCSRPVSVRRSVRACVRLTLACCIHTAEDIVKLLSLSDSPIILVFGPGADTQFQGEPPSSGVQNTQGRENVRFSTEIAIYLGNGMR